MTCVRNTAQDNIIQCIGSSVTSATLSDLAASGQVAALADMNMCVPGCQDSMPPVGNDLNYYKVILLGPHTYVLYNSAAQTCIERLRALTLCSHLHN